jgi:hypothetical protein
LIPGTNYTEAQKVLALQFITYVKVIHRPRSLTSRSNFITFSDPNGAPEAVDRADIGGNSSTVYQPPEWPGYSTGEIAYMKSSNLTFSADDYRKEQIDFMNSDPDIIRGF